MSDVPGCSSWTSNKKPCVTKTPVVTKCWKWDLPCEISAPNIRQNLNYGVLVLNRPIVQSRQFIEELWNNATFRMTVDGGTLQWDKYLSKCPEDVLKNIRKPDMITGDFDSITDEILQKYKLQGCKIIHTPDQDHTDFTKALMELNKHCEQNEIKISHVVAIGQSSGRLDQILGNLQTMFLAIRQPILKSTTDLYLLSDDTLSWLLQPGLHMIMVPEATRTHKNAWCSITPVGETCLNITTYGLRWNINNKSLKFGELVSTSNAFDVVSTSNDFDGSDSVKIKCSHTVLWSMRICNLIDDTEKS